MHRNWPAPFVSPAKRPKNLVGYDEVCSGIVKYLLQRQGDRVAVWGPSGSGKSALVQVIGSIPEVIDHFGDGILWAYPTEYIGSGAILGAWAYQLGSDLSRISKVEDRRQNLRELLRHKRVLIILDGVEHARQVHELDCAGSGSATLLTTRDERIAQEFAESVTWHLEGLRSDQVSSYLSAQEPSYDWEGWMQNDMRWGEAPISPLALKLIAGILNARLVFPELGQELNSSRQDTSAGGVYHSDFPFGLTGGINPLKILERSRNLLPEGLQDVFLNLLAFAPEPDRFSRMAAASVAHAADRDLETLVACHLIEEDGDGLSTPRFFHDYLSKQAPLSSRERHRRYYLELLSSPLREPDDISQIYGQCMYSSRLKGVEDHRREIVNELSAYQEELGLWDDYRNCAELALQACKSHSLCREEGQLCNNLGKATHMLGDVQFAIEYYRLAEDLLGKEGNLAERALVMNNIASILVEKGQLEEAQIELSRAIALLEDEPGNPLQAYLYNNLGKIYDDLGLTILAKDEYIKALQKLEAGTDEELEMTVRFNLALAFQALGSKDAALGELRRAVAIEEKLGHPNLIKDAEILEKLTTELSGPKVLHWFRKKFLD